MKKILIYGDSNVWGDNFITGKRIPDENQWVNILRDNLGSEYQIFQEGLPGRIAGNEDRTKPYKNGKDTFMSIFRTNAPVDTLVIALGTNDLQLKYNKSSQKIINDLLWYENTVKELYEDEESKIKYFVDEKMPRIIYILPINFDYKVDASVIFDEKSEKKRNEIIDYFKKNKNDIVIFNELDLFKDGIHLNYEGHKKVADRMYEVVENEKC